MKSSSKFKSWEIALLLALCATFLIGSWAQGEQSALASKIIRLHVIAESDAQEDQALKLAVRDSVLKAAAPLLEGAPDAAAAEAILNESLPLLEAAAADTVRAQGFDCGVAATLSQERYPTREYETFALPAGRYTSLRIVLGEGAGKNWWCVIYPELCLDAASEPITDVTGLTGEDVALISEADEGYVLKFKILEIWGKFSAWAGR